MTEVLEDWMLPEELRLRFSSFPFGRIRPASVGSVPERWHPFQTEMLWTQISWGTI